MTAGNPTEAARGLIDLQVEGIDRISSPLLQHLLQRKGLFTSKQQKQYHNEIIRSLMAYPRQMAIEALREIVDNRHKRHAKLAAECLQQLTGGTP